MEKTVIGSGIFNLDIIVKRDYPEWPQLRPFTDNVVLEEVGGTCGNVLCMLSSMGWDAWPLACLDDSPEGLKITEDLKRYGCDCRFVSNTPDGGYDHAQVHAQEDCGGWTQDECPCRFSGWKSVPQAAFPQGQG